MANGELLAFTDPDAYAHANWLERLVEANQGGLRVSVGAVACFGRRWLDRGAHLCKFYKWLPMEQPNRLREGPTVNLLLSRELLQRAGGRFQSELHGDTDVCWRLGRMGVETWSVPNAIVEHHHLHTWRSLLVERFGRGAGYAALQLAWRPTGGPALLFRLVVTLLPLRLATQLWRVGRNAERARMLRTYLLTLPVIATGLYSALLGEAQALRRHLLRSAELPSG